MPRLIRYRLKIVPRLEFSLGQNFLGFLFEGRFGPFEVGFRGLGKFVFGRGHVKGNELKGNGPQKAKM